MISRGNPGLCGGCQWGLFLDRGEGVKLRIIDLGQRESDSNLRKAGTEITRELSSRIPTKTFELESELDGVLISLCELWVPPKIVLHDEGWGGRLGRGQAVKCDTLSHYAKKPASPGPFLPRLVFEAFHQIWLVFL